MDVVRRLIAVDDLHVLSGVNSNDVRKILASFLLNLDWLGGSFGRFITA
jgi:hypothetical protein